MEDSSKSNLMFSNRNLDIQQESIISNIMTTLYKERGFSVTSTTREQDIDGVDVILNKDGIKYLVDEKAAIKYLTKDLKTFGFELCKVGYHNSVGWFADSHKLTTHYNIIYPKSSTNDINNLNSIESFLLNSNELKSLVFPEMQKYGIHFDNISSFMMRQKSYRGRRYFQLNEYMKLVYSECVIPEKPINIIINKQYLKDIAIEVFYKEF